MRRFTAVLVALALVALAAAPAMAAPGIKFSTHLTVDGVAVAGHGTTADPFVITTDGVAGVMHTIGMADTLSRPALLPTNPPDNPDYMFFLIAAAPQQATLVSYFTAKGWPEIYLDQIKSQIRHTPPFFPFFYFSYRNGGYQLSDGFHANLMCGVTSTPPPYCFPIRMYPLQIDDDYPTGIYSYEGVLKGKNHSQITFTFVMQVVRSV